MYLKLKYLIYFIEVVWYKDDELIKQSRYFRMTSDRESHTLRIYEAFSEDEGIYRCCVGKASTSAKLRVISEYQICKYYCCLIVIVIKSF